MSDIFVPAAVPIRRPRGRVNACAREQSPAEH
jgi:hypothetical protein